MAACVNGVRRHGRDETLAMRGEERARASMLRLCRQAFALPECVREGLERRTMKDARSSLVAQVMVACSTPTVATDRAVAARSVTATHSVAVS